MIINHHLKYSFLSFALTRYGMVMIHNCVHTQTITSTHHTHTFVYFDQLTLYLPWHTCNNNNNNNNINNNNNNIINNNNSNNINNNNNN